MLYSFYVQVTDIVPNIKSLYMNYDAIVTNLEIMWNLVSVSLFQTFSIVIFTQSFQSIQTYP